MNNEERKPPMEGAGASKGEAWKEARQDAPICAGALSHPYAAWTKGQPSDAQIARWRRGALVLPSRKVSFPWAYTFDGLVFKKRIGDRCGGWYFHRWGK
jgi:hypothetical protein